MKKRNSLLLIFFFLSICFGRGRYDNFAPPDALCHYEMDDNADSNVVIDSTGYFNGTFHGDDSNTSAHHATGQIGGALRFDGIADYIDTGQPFEEIFQDDFTISLWAKPTDGQPAAEQAFFGMWSDEAQYRPQMEIHLLQFPDVGGAGRIYFEGRTSTESAVGGFDVYSSTGFLNGQETWHHIVCTGKQITPTTATFSIYFDGILVGSQTLTQVLSEFNTGFNSYIGAVLEHDDDTGDYIAQELFSGSLDDVRIWKKALTSNEILDLYKSATIVFNNRSRYSY